MLGYWHSLDAYKCALRHQAAEKGEQDSHSYSLAHTFVLEAAEITETPRTTVTLQLLGPHTVK